MPERKRFAILGTGFWARYQLAAWRELSGAECVALYNRTRSKAERLAGEFSIPAVYEDAEELMRREQLDFVDIITDVGTHRRFVELAAKHGLPAICQKPMGTTVAEAEAMIGRCVAAGVSLWVHENWRWQAPIRAVKAALDSEVIGRVFRARLDYINSFPVFDNQPFLRECERFILADMGTHLLDTARFLFGEPRLLYAQATRVHREIRGEDVATVQYQTREGCTVLCQLSYASPVRHDRFPETLVFVEGERGSVELGPDSWLHVTTRDGTRSRRIASRIYSWADPRYALVHASIVECNANLLAAVRGETRGETTALDNLRTLKMVDAAYDSIAAEAAIPLHLPEEVSRPDLS